MLFVDINEIQLIVYMYLLCAVVMFSIDSSTENIRVPERNESVEVCIRRTGDTVNDYDVTLEAKMNTGGNIANGNRNSMQKSSTCQYFMAFFQY